MITRRSTSNWTSVLAWLLPTIVGVVFRTERAVAQCSPIEVAQIKASDGSPFDSFGASVSISGGLLAVGASFDDDLGVDSGSVYLFERDDALAGKWIQIAKLHALDGIANQGFGRAVSLSGNVLVVGVPEDDDLGLHAGAAYVFERDHGGANQWGPVAKLHASDGSQDDSFGLSVAISGDACVVGAYFADRAGAITGSAYVYSRDHGGLDEWGEVAKLVASDAKHGDRFGNSVAISETTVVIGAHGHDGNGPQAGAAYVYELDSNSQSTWQESAILLASDGDGGDQFGSVSVSIDTIVVGSSTDGPIAISSGSAYVFERDFGGSSNWGQVAKLFPADGAVGDEFGRETSVSGSTAVIRSTFDDDSGLSSGSAYVFERDHAGANKWGLVTKLLASDGAEKDFFGVPAVSEGTIVVGAHRHQDSGAAYVFEYRPAYEPKAYCTSKVTSIPDCVPEIQANGTASASSLGGFELNCATIPGQSMGIFLYTHVGAASVVLGPFGTLCIDGGALFRTGHFQSTGTPSVCDGILSFDWNAYASSAIFYDPASTHPGTTVDGQFWYRDPPNRGAANLSEAIAFIICR